MGVFRLRTAPRPRPGAAIPPRHAGRQPECRGVGGVLPVIPVHQPGGLWDRVLGALEPSRWAKAFALDSKYFAFQLPFILIGLDEGDTFHLMETDANGVDVKYLVR